jgi:hypothetical protein
MLSHLSRAMRGPLREKLFDLAKRYDILAGGEASEESHRTAPERPAPSGAAPAGERRAT